MASWLVHLTPEPAVWVRALAAGHCVVFLGETLYSQGASLYPGVSLSTGEFNAEGNPAMDWHAIQRGVKYCQSLHDIETVDKRRPDVCRLLNCYWAKASLNVK